MKSSDQGNILAIKLFDPGLERINWRYGSDYLVSRGQTVFSRHGAYRLHYKRLLEKGSELTAYSGLICQRHLDLRNFSSRRL